MRAELTGYAIWSRLISVIPATTLAGIKVLNHVINAAILVFVLSAANSDLYIGSRTMYALAIEGQAPRVFRKVNHMGVPWPALLLCLSFCCLVFLNVHSSSQKGERTCITRPHVSDPRSLRSVWVVRQPRLNFWRHNMDVYLLFPHVSSFITLYHLTFNKWPF